MVGLVSRASDSRLNIRLRYLFDLHKHFKKKAESHCPFKTLTRSPGALESPQGGILWRSRCGGDFAGANVARDRGGASVRFKSFKTVPATNPTPSKTMSRDEAGRGKA